MDYKKVDWIASNKKLKAKMTDLESTIRQSPRYQVLSTSTKEVTHEGDYILLRLGEFERNQEVFEQLNESIGRLADSQGLEAETDCRAEGDTESARPEELERILKGLTGYRFRLNKKDLEIKRS